MERYSEYKDSGVDWIGEIPKDWEIKQFRFLFSENNTKNVQLKYKTQLQFKYGEIVHKENQSIDTDVLKTIKNYTVVHPNDIMINGLNLNYDFVSQRVGMVKNDGVITSAYISLHPLEHTNAKYYTYLMKAMDARKLFHGMGSGIRLTLGFKNLKNIYLPRPSKIIQEKIVTYLDNQCKQIDFVISQQQKMIDLLNERKQIIINQAVTKGINPNVEMKDSGVDWIGEIPKDWEIKPLKTLCSFSKGLSITKEDLQESGISVISYGQIHSKLNTRTYISSDLIRYISKDKTIGKDTAIVTKGDFIVADTSEDIDGCGNMVYNDTDNLLYAGYHTIILNNINIKYPKYLAYLFSSNAWRKQIRSRVNGVKVYSITKGILKQTSVLIPTESIQFKIIEYLDTHISAIDSLLINIQKKMSLLQERKQIIINDVVLGKVKVS